MTPTFRYFYVNRENEPVGPFLLEELHKMVDAGLIAPDNPVCPEGGEDWIALDALLGKTPPATPVNPPPRQASDLTEGQYRTERNAAGIVIASLLFPALMIFLTLGIAANPVLYAMGRAIQSGFMVGFLFVVIGVLGPINAIKLIRIPGISQRRPAALTLAWVGVVLFVLGLGLLLLIGVGLEAAMVRSNG